MVAGEDNGMRATAVAAILFILFLMPAYALVYDVVPRTYSAYGTFESTPCEECPNFENYEYPFIFSSVDVEGRAAAYSMAVSKDGRREPVDGATLFVQIYDSNWEVIGRCRLHTDESGTGTLDYSDYMGGPKNCTNGCVARASFCCGNPVALKCAISNCLGEELGDYAGYPPSYPPCKNYDGGAWPSYAAVGGTEYAIMPASTDALIPAEQETLPLSLGFSLCFPLTVIFGLLAAAMYASGRDPFAMFSFYTPRYSKGYERPMGARGFTLIGTGILSAISGSIKLGDYLQGVTGKKGGKVGEGNKAAAPAAGAAPVVKGQAGGVHMAAGTGGHIVARPRSMQETPGAETPAGRPGGGLEGRITSQPASAAGGAVDSQAERAAEARMGGPIGMMIRAMFGDADSWEALKAMFRQFRPDVASGATGENAYFGMGFGEFTLQLTSTLFCYSALPIFVINLIDRGFRLAIEPLEGARNLENMDHDVEMLRNIHQNADGSVTVTYTDVYGNKSTETFERGSARFANFMSDMHQRFQLAQEFNSAALQDSNAGLANASHDALSGEGRGDVVSGLVDGRGMEKELENIWLSPNAANLGAVLDKHITPEISDNISMILTNKKADGTVATADERAAAITFVQNNREAINAALSAVLVFANRGGDIASVSNNPAVSALLGLAGTAGAVEGWHQAGWLLTDANGKIDLSTFNSLGMLAATLRASEDAASAALGGRIDTMLSNAVEAMRQNAEAARTDPTKVFSEGSETERRSAQLVLGELMYQSEFYITGEGGSAEGRFADMSYYAGGVHGSIRGMAGDLSGDSLDQFNAALGKFEGFAGMASAMDEELSALPAGAQGAAAVFGVASAWLEQHGTALETAKQLAPIGAVVNAMYTEALYDNPAMRDALSPVVGGRDERDAALNGLWDQVIDPREKRDEYDRIDVQNSRDIRQAIAVAYDPHSTLEELATAADIIGQKAGLTITRQDFIIIGSEGSSNEDVRAALARIQPDAGIGSMTDADVARFRDDTLRAFDMTATSSHADAERQATLAFNPFLEQVAREMVPQYEEARKQGMNEEGRAAFDALLQATSGRGEILLAPPQDYTNAVELARNLFSFDGTIDAREQQALDTLSNPSSTQDELRGAVDYVGNRFYADHSTMEQRDAYTTLMNEDASRQEQNRAAAELTQAARVDWVGLQTPTMSPNEAIGMWETRMNAPDTSAEDRARLQQEIDMLKAVGINGIGAAMQDGIGQIRASGTSDADIVRLQQEVATLYQLAQDVEKYNVGDGRSQLDSLPQPGAFTDLTHRTAEGYFNGPLGRDAMANPQQTLDEFGMLNPTLATYKAETQELSPESQRIEDREEGERKAAERGGFGAEWQAAESAIAAKKADEERRRRGLGEEGEG